MSGTHEPAGMSRLDTANLGDNAPLVTPISATTSEIAPLVVDAGSDDEYDVLSPQPHVTEDYRPDVVEDLFQADDGLKPTDVDNPYAMEVDSGDESQEDGSNPTGMFQASRPLECLTRYHIPNT